MGLDVMEPSSSSSPATWLARSTTSSSKHVAPYPASATNNSNNNNSNCHTSATTSATSANSNTTSSRLRRKSSASRMRKSMSDKPLDASDHHQSSDVSQHYQHYHNSASLRSVVDDNQLESETDPELAARRARIMARAEEILRGKRHVGMQFGDTCPVCLADDVDTQLTQCGHRLHAKCIKRWLQSGTRCPVCREHVTGVHEAFAAPAQAHFEALTKDYNHSRHEVPTPDSASTSQDEQHSSGGFEWGWFEDFDEFDEQNDESAHFGANGGLLLPMSMRSQRRASMPSLLTSSVRSDAALMNRELSGAFEICRTFPPLRPVYDSPYACSPHAWMRALPSHRHIAAKIQIRSFRIVEAKGYQHAEYLVELQLDGRYFSRWRRFSALSRFVSTVGSSEFRETHAAWAKLEACGRWFNRLELAYLHERCKLLEHFAHTLLIECSTAHPLANLLDC